MDRIVIEVEDRLARTWRYASNEQRDEIKREVEKQLDNVLRRQAELNFNAHLEQAREEAASNGLTEETLIKLLNEE